MTTNVLDRIVGQIATDSRWSVTWGSWLIYLDDIGFDKIEIADGYAFMFAGFAARIDEWKRWLRKRTPAGQPAHDGMAVCMVRVSDREVLFSAGVQIKHPTGEAYFAGSGSRFAYMCWDQNRDAQRSVVTAKQFDVCTGGDVKFLDMVSGNHNLIMGSVVGFDDVARQLARRGLVMDIKSGTPPTTAPFALKDAAASNEVLREASDKILSGELRPCAPCDHMYNHWTDEEKEALNKALAEAFGWE